MKRVVHYWNICGIGGLLARYLDRDFPYESVVVDRGHANRFGHNDERTLVWENRAVVWLARCLWHSRNFDIIHVHSGVQWLLLFRLFNPGKKIVIHLHGTKIRGRWDQEPGLKFADQIIVSTPDLLEGSPEGTQYLPNPVDERLIEIIKKGMKGIEKIPMAIHCDRYAKDEAIEYAKRFDLEEVIHDRDKVPLPHAAFLSMIAQYTHYIDVKRDFPGHIAESKILQAHSMTGLEALALGLNVIDWGGRICKGQPREHRSFNVASKLNEIYQGMEEDDMKDCDIYQSELCGYYWFKYHGNCRYKQSHNVQCLLGVDSEFKENPDKYRPMEETTN